VASIDLTAHRRKPLAMALGLNTDVLALEVADGL
jgi:hypothetical protein